MLEETVLADRIKTSLVKWMAAGQAAEAQAYALEDAVLRDSILHIFGTRRMKAARGGEQRRDNQLVRANKANRDRTRQIHLALHF
jgi:hypothetical protein